MFENKVVAVKSLHAGDTFRTFRHNRRSGVTRYSQWYTLVREPDVHPGLGVILDYAYGQSMVLAALADVEVQS